MFGEVVLFLTILAGFYGACKIQNFFREDEEEDEESDGQLYGVDWLLHEAKQRFTFEHCLSYHIFKDEDLVWIQRPWADNPRAACIGIGKGEMFVWKVFEVNSNPTAVGAEIDGGFDYSVDRVLDVVSKKL